jgi:tellurite resistance protein TerC
METLPSQGALAGAQATLPLFSAGAATAAPPLLMWSGFAALLVLLLAVDLWSHRSPREIPLREAARWTVGWLLLGFAFSGVIWVLRGADASLQYLAGYVVEWSLSVDNVFVFAMLLTGLAVPSGYRHRVLFIGALGALVLRLGFILAAFELLHRVEWLLQIFGVLLVIAAVRFLRADHGGPAPSGGRGARLLRRLLPVSRDYDGGHLVTRVGGRRMVTPMLLALVLVALADVVFAVDSVPAVLAMTDDAFVAFSANALAVLGLRSLYFLLDGAMHRFRSVQPAVALLLAVVGLKLLVTPVVEVPAGLSLSAIVAILGGAAIIGWLRSGRPTRPDSRKVTGDTQRQAGESTGTGVVASGSPRSSPQRRQ